MTAPKRILPAAAHTEARRGQLPPHIDEPEGAPRPGGATRSSARLLAAPQAALNFEFLDHWQTHRATRLHRERD